MFKKICKCALGLIIVMSLLVSCSGKSADVVSNNKVDGKPILSNQIFSIEVPGKFAGKYNTEANDNSINLYDVESKKAGFDGWLFGIYAYKDPNKWAGGPIEKVGELLGDDNELYDIVIAYPTESQFGFDREMPATYKSIYEARYDIAMTVKNINGDAIDYGKGAKGDGLYNDILDKYVSIIMEKNDSAENVSPEICNKVNDEDALDKIAYVYCDVNNDGIEELLLGEIAEGEWKNVIYDIYTMVNRNPEYVISGWDRNRYYALTGGLISNEYSGGANESGTRVYNLITNSTELMFQLAIKYDGYENADKPYFIAYSEKDDDFEWENIDEDKFNEMTKRFSDKKTPDYKPLSSYKSIK